MDGENYAQVVHCAYEVIVHWRRNVLKLPSGKVGKQFLRELPSLFQAYAQGSALESVTLESVMVACVLLLQEPHPASKSRDHVAALERRLHAWHEADIDGLMREGRTIQNHLRLFSRVSPHDQTQQNIRTFSKLVFEGKIHSALRFLSDNHGCGVMDLSKFVDEKNDRTVLDVLREKHPCVGAVCPEALVTTSDKPVESHPVLFERLTGSAIRSAALRTQGTAGPSGIDAAGWRQMYTAFHPDSADLCAAIAAAGRRLCNEFVDPKPLSTLLACR